MKLLRRVSFAVVGTLVLALGVALLVLPGPGMLLVFAGLAMLASVFPRLQRFVEPVRRRAMDAAAASVSSPWRLAGSVALGTALIAAGLVWGLVTRLPFSGWATGSSLVLSGLVVFALLAYSLRRARDDGAEGSFPESPEHR